jgi:hypothetical protein
MQMGTQQLKELGLEKVQDALFVVSEGENGRIVFDPVLWEIKENPGIEGDPTVGIAIEICERIFIFKMMETIIPNKD